MSETAGGGLFAGDVSSGIWTAAGMEGFGWYWYWYWREVGVDNVWGGRSGLEGTVLGREEKTLHSFRVRALGWRLHDWMVRQVSATAVTSVECKIAEPKSRTCAFDKDQALRFPSHDQPDSCCSDSGGVWSLTVVEVG